MAETQVDSLASGTDEPPLEWLSNRRVDWWTRLAGSGTVVLLAIELTLILLVWEVAVGVLELVNPTFLPPPTAIAAGFWDLVMGGELWDHVSVSLLAWFTGFVLAVGVGIAVGVALGTSLPVHRLAGPLLWSFYAVPWLAYRPLSKAWFGFGLEPVIFLVFIAAVFPTMFNTAAGVSRTDVSLLNAGRVFGVRGWRVARKIVLPSALPFILAGIRQSVVLATIALIVAEMTGPSVGVGSMIIYKTNSFAIDQAFAGIALAVVWTVSMSQLVGFLGRRLTPWQTDVRAR